MDQRQKYSASCSSSVPSIAQVLTVSHAVQTRESDKFSTCKLRLGEKQSPDSLEDGETAETKGVLVEETS